MKNKERADVLLVQAKLAPSRTRAQALIAAGKVFDGEQKVLKAGQLFSSDVQLQVRQAEHPYVSRGGVKLAGALDAFGLDCSGWVAADVGASTGGFTDCLLQRGAKKVYAIDVGYGQLDYRLRSDPRVVVMERTNARHLKNGDLPESMDAVVIDASFISLTKLLPACIELLNENGVVIAMVKPQFEVGPQVAKKGVVRDTAQRQHAIDEVARAAASLGLVESARSDCVIKGPKGNHEAFLLLKLQKH